MLDLNEAWSRAAHQAKQKAKKEKIKKIQAEAMATCEGKVSFDTYTLAKKVCDAPRKQLRQRKVYRCYYCKKYHLG